MALSKSKKSEKHKDTTVTDSKEDKSLLGKKNAEKAKDNQVLGKDEEYNPPDGGWGWIVCLASFWTNGTIFGILNTFGILYVEMLNNLDDGTSSELAFKISWIGALQITMTFFLSPVASILVDRFGIRPTAFTGACIATVGMLLSSFVNQVEVLYLTYGLLLGIGSSLIYNPSLVILGHYFKRHLGVVNGLVSFGSAVFTIVLPFLLKETLSSIGLKNTMRMLAGLLSVLMIGSLTWKPLFEVRHSELDHYLSTGSMKETAKGFRQWIKKFLNVGIWKNKGYVIWAICLPIAFLGYFIPFVHLVKHTNLVMPGANSEVLVMCIGATSGVSRLIFGKVADMPKVNRVRMQQIAFVIHGIVTACIPLATEFWMLIVLTLSMGISDGIFICLLGPIAFDLLGPAGAAQGLGCTLGISSIPMTAGPPLAALAFDYMGSYEIAFYAAGIPPIISAILMFLIPKKQGEKYEIEEIPKPKASHSIVANFVALSRENLDKVGIDDDMTFRSTELLPIKLLKRDIEMSITRSSDNISRSNKSSGHLMSRSSPVRKADSLPSLAQNGSGASQRIRTEGVGISPLAMENSDPLDSSYA